MLPGLVNRDTSRRFVIIAVCRNSIIFYFASHDNSVKHSAADQSHTTDHKWLLNKQLLF